MMKKIEKYGRNLIVEIICYLFIALFIYAAFSKLLDYEQFRVQIGQSPLLTAFADWVVWGVPAIEIIIAVILVIQRFRLLGLFASFSLMCMFTTYIFLILNFSDYIPCSCGGVLEDLGWTEHLIFNIAFILLALIGIVLSSRKNNKNLETAIISLITTWQE